MLLKTLCYKLVNLFFPINCLICAKEDELACQDCLKKVNLKVNFQEGFQFLDALYFLSEYKTEFLFIKALWEWKYNLNKEGRSLLFNIIGNYFRSDQVLSGLLEDRANIFTFVPTSREKFKLRGFNQAREIADFILKRKAQAILLKLEQKDIQMKLTADERYTNVQGNFRVLENTNLMGKTVLIFDDICTTGATLEEIARVLKEAGAAAVCGVVLARKF